MFKKILLLMAMPQEAQVIIKELKLKKIKNPISKLLPTSIYKTRQASKHIVLAVSDYCQRFEVARVGSQAAILLAWEAIRTFQPDIVINLGTGGGFKTRGAMIGDIFLSANPIRYHDRNFHSNDKNYYSYAIGDYPCFNSASLAKQLGVKTGIISTGNTMLSSNQEYQQMKKNCASVKEMEAAAIAEAAFLLKVPFIALKVVTDLVDIKHCPQKQFDLNFQSAIEGLAITIKRLIPLI